MQRVVASAAIQAVTPRTTEENIVTRIAGEIVVAIIPIDGIVAIERMQEIITCATTHDISARRTAQNIILITTNDRRHRDRIVGPHGAVSEFKAGDLTRVPGVPRGAPSKDMQNV